MAVISDHHSTNVSAFNILIKKYPHTRKDISVINHPSNMNNGIYLFFDSVHLLKNIRNNLFNSRRFIFPQFNFAEFYDSIKLDAGETKQSVSLALSIFDATTSTAIKSYYPDRYNASGFVKLINLW